MSILRANHLIAVSTVIDRIDFRSGKITHNSFAVDFSKSPEDQMWDMTEDLVQVVYSIDDSQYVIDLGWYSGDEFTQDSRFMVVIAKDSNWDDLFFSRDARTEDELEASLNEAVEIIAALYWRPNEATIA